MLKTIFYDILYDLYTPSQDHNNIRDSSVSFQVWFHDLFQVCVCSTGEACCKDQAKADLTHGGRGRFLWIKVAAATISHQVLESQASDLQSTGYELLGRSIASSSSATLDCLDLDLPVAGVDMMLTSDLNLWLIEAENDQFNLLALSGVQVFPPFSGLLKLLHCWFNGLMEGSSPLWGEQLTRDGGQLGCTPDSCFLANGRSNTGVVQKWLWFKMKNHVQTHQNTVLNAMKPQQKQIKLTQPWNWAEIIANTILVWRWWVYSKAAKRSVAETTRSRSLRS